MPEQSLPSSLQAEGRHWEVLGMSGGGMEEAKKRQKSTEVVK
jgi:hypothetical protein